MMFKLFKNTHGEVAIGEIIMVVITIAIALALTPVVMDSVESASNETTGAAATMLDLVPLLYVVGVALLAVVWIVSMARRAGGT